MLAFVMKFQLRLLKNVAGEKDSSYLFLLLPLPLSSTGETFMRKVSDLDDLTTQALSASFTDDDVAKIGLVFGRCDKSPGKPEVIVSNKYLDSPPPAFTLGVYDSQWLP